jgi:hypothetical protein
VVRDDDRDVLERVVGLDRCEDLASVPPGEVEIEQHEIGARGVGVGGLPVQEGQRRVSITDHVEPSGQRLGEPFLDHDHVPGVVFDQQHTHAEGVRDGHGYSSVQAAVEQDLVTRSVSRGLFLLEARPDDAWSRSSRRQHRPHEGSVVAQHAAALIADAIGLDELGIDAESRAVALVVCQAVEAEQRQRGIACSLGRKKIAVVDTAVALHQLDPSGSEAPKSVSFAESIT